MSEFTLIENRQLIDNGDKNIIPNLQNAVVLIELLSASKEGFTLPEMVERMGVPKTTLFRITNTLQINNFLYRDEETNRFRLTRKFLRIGLSAMGEQSIIEKSLAPMRELRDEIKETVLLGALIEDNAVLLEQTMGTHPFTFYVKPGKNFILHASVPGKILLAYSNESEKERILSKMTFDKFNERTITSIDAFRKEMDQVRNLGYATDCAEEIDGVHCVGAPIFDQNGEILAAIWTTGPSGRLTSNQFTRVAEKIMDCTNKISKSFGYKI